MRHERIGVPAESRTRRIAGAASWLARFTALFLLVSVAAHRFGQILTPEFFWLLATGALLAILALMLAVAALRRAWRHGETGSGRAAGALALALMMLAPYGFAGWQVWRLPALDDVTTDPLDPPQFRRLQRRAEGMNPADAISDAEARLQAEAYPGVTGRRYPAAPDMVERALANLLNARGWQVRGRREGAAGLEMTIEATGRTAIFGFPFDIAIRITDEEDTTYVDLRSASRYGAHDLGSNAARILDFMTELDLEMARQAGLGDADEVPES